LSQVEANQGRDDLTRELIEAAHIFVTNSYQSRLISSKFLRIFEKFRKDISEHLDREFSFDLKQPFSSNDVITQHFRMNMFENVFYQTFSTAFEKLSTFTFSNNDFEDVVKMVQSKIFGCSVQCPLCKATCLNRKSHRRTRYRLSPSTRSCQKD